MKSKLRLGLFLIACLPAMAQLDSYALRARFGAPLNRETFRMPAGFDLTVDYGTANQVCKLEVPALMPSNEKVSSAVVMKQRMYDFLAGLLPPALRGKELSRRSMSTGGTAMLFTEYEHLIVGETQTGDPFRGTITVTFQGNGCQPPAAQ